MSTFAEKLEGWNKSIEKTNSRYTKLLGLGYKDTRVALSNEKYAITYNQLEVMSDEDFKHFVDEAIKTNKL